MQARNMIDEHTPLGLLTAAVQELDAPPSGLAPDWQQLWSAAALRDPFRRDVFACELRWERRDSALWHVHRREQARLLAEVVLLLASALPDGAGIWFAPSPVRWDAWRARARAELCLAHSSGIPAPRALLIACLWRPGWIGIDGISAMARAAVALEPAAGSFLALARSRILGGEASGALAALDRALRVVGPSEVGLASALERCRLVALESRGDLKAALAAIGCLQRRLQQAGQPWDDLALDYLGLGLALVLADEEGAQAYASNLDRHSSQPHLLRALELRVARWLGEGIGGLTDPKQMGRSAAELIERRGAGPSTEVARLFCVDSLYRENRSGGERR